jgi:UDP-N-acetylmuramyl pentapeptide phosphotransferase/UDP-N-acetylglucosamine-1-phosphate transferase
MTLSPGLVISSLLVLGSGVVAAVIARLLVTRHIAVDTPNDRSLHRVVTPRGGGLGMVIAAAITGLAALLWRAPAAFDVPTAAWMLGLTCLVALFSYFGGDRHRLSALRRFVLQIAVAAVWIWQAGAAFTVIQLPGLWTIDLGLFGPILTVGFVVWTMNLFNFMDGMDGLAGSMIAIGCAAVALIAYLAGHPTLPILAAIASASALGFLWFNYPPASIFMGDVGSVSFGFFVAALITAGARDGVAGPITTGLAFAPFFVDATATLIKRALRGEQVWIAHRTHWYQRLVLAGWSHRRTLRAEIALMVISGIVAAVSASRSAGWIVLALAWIVPYLGLSFLVRRVEAASVAESKTQAFPASAPVAPPVSRLL